MDWCLAKNRENWARDEEKREACNKHGITLIEIDYGWDGTVEAVRRAAGGDFRPFRPKLERNEAGFTISVE